MKRPTTTTPAVLLIAIFLVSLNVQRLIVFDDHIEHPLSVYSYGGTVSQKPVCLAPQLSPSEQQGTWMGNWWVPPSGWEIFGPEDLRHIFHNTSMLWLGDSTARRTSTTLYHIIENHNVTEALGRKEMNPKSRLNINKGVIVEPCLKWDNSSLHYPYYCRTMPNRPENDFIHMFKPCFHEIAPFLRDEIAGLSNVTDNINVLVVSMGVWHVVHPKECLDFDNTTEWLDQVLESLYDFQRARPHVKVIWRTSNYDPKHSAPKTELINEYSMEQIDKYQSELSASETARVTYIDWGTAVRSRTVGKDRVPADINPHTGLEPRLVMIQMIANLLRSDQEAAEDCVDSH